MHTAREHAQPGLLKEAGFLAFAGSIQHRSATALLAAGALQGKPEALRELAALEPARSAIEAHRVGPLLYSAAIAAAIDGTEVRTWLDATRQSSVRQLTLRHTLSTVAGILDEAGVPWLPIKGIAVAEIAYDRVEHRPTSDLDILIPEDRFTDARNALERRGWKTVGPNAHVDSYLRHEGYAWQAIGSTPGILELHHRLWGSAPDSFVASLWRRARPADPGSGGSRYAVDPLDHYLIAAIHLWQSTPPRPLIVLVDLLRLLTLAGDGGIGTLVERTVADDLQLFVGLAARAVARLSDDSRQRELAASLDTTLHRFERLVVRRAERREPLEIPLSTLVVARLLDGRRSRAGWRSVWRRVWPHPAIVAQSTPSNLPWWLRRILAPLPAGWQSPHETRARASEDATNPAPDLGPDTMPR